MSYNKYKPIIYGVIGIALALSILAFIPTTPQIRITTSVSLEIIPGYGIQTIKISEEATQLTNLILKITSIEAQMPNGEWVQITTEENQWDIRQETQKTFTINPAITGYTKLRLTITQSGSSATLKDGQTIQLGLPSQPLEIELPQPTESGNALRLSLSQGTVSTQILPNLQIEITTNKISGEILAP